MRRINFLYSAQLHAHTQEEVGYMSEIAQEAALQMHRNVLVEGALRDAEWYTRVFEQIRSRHPDYRILIVYVHADQATIASRCLQRSKRTERHVPLDRMVASIEQATASVIILGSLADGVVQIDNS